jgi:hypothetical protein
VYVHGIGYEFGVQRHERDINQQYQSLLVFFLKLNECTSAKELRLGMPHCLITQAKVAVISHAANPAEDSARALART